MACPGLRATRARRADRPGRHGRFREEAGRAPALGPAHRTGLYSASSTRGTPADRPAGRPVTTTAAGKAAPEGPRLDAGRSQGGTSADGRCRRPAAARHRPQARQALPARRRRSRPRGARQAQRLAAAAVGSSRAGSGVASSRRVPAASSSSVLSSALARLPFMRLGRCQHHPCPPARRRGLCEGTDPRASSSRGSAALGVSPSLSAGAAERSRRRGFGSSTVRSGWARLPNQAAAARPPQAPLYALALAFAQPGLGQREARPLADRPADRGSARGRAACCKASSSRGRQPGRGHRCRPRPPVRPRPVPTSAGLASVVRAGPAAACGVATREGLVLAPNGRLAQRGAAPIRSLGESGPGRRWRDRRMHRRRAAPKNSAPCVGEAVGARA